MAEHQELQTTLRHMEEALWRVVTIPSLARELEEKEVLRIAAEEVSIDCLINVSVIYFHGFTNKNCLQIL